MCIGCGLQMNSIWEGVIAGVDTVFPYGTTRRKLLQLLAIILLFEGLSVPILFSYAGVWVGVLSIAMGVFILLIAPPVAERKGDSGDSSRLAQLDETKKVPPEDPPGMRLIDAIMKRIGNDYVIMGIGAAIVILVVIWNAYLSIRPSYGDLDTLSIMFGGLIMVFPLLVRRFKIEASFCLLFIGLVVLFLVIPQAAGSIHKSTGSSVGSWYVHYMLAAPFAGILDLIGIDAVSYKSIVSIQFHDGTMQALSISAYCAGLYSFSIFLAAFSSFVLVFERLPVRTLSFVLALGLLIAYLGNLFRMVVIGIVGYYEGIDALLWTHRNAGWIIFLGWSAAFWYFLLGYVSRRPSRGIGKTDVD
jgi:exosortase/archaeosortase family protein